MPTGRTPVPSRSPAPATNIRSSRPTAGRSRSSRRARAIRRSSSCRSRAASRSRRRSSPAASRAPRSPKTAGFSSFPRTSSPTAAPTPRATGRAPKRARRTSSRPTSPTPSSTGTGRNGRRASARTSSFSTFAETDAKKALRDLTPGDFDSPVFAVGGGHGFDLSPDGAELAFSSNRDPDPALSTNADVFTVPVSGDAAALESPKNLTASNAGFDGSPRYSPDGRFLAFLRQTTPRYEADRLRLMLLDREIRRSPRPDRVLRRHASGLRVLEGRVADLLHGRREGDARRSTRWTSRPGRSARSRRSASSTRWRSPPTARGPPWPAAASEARSSCIGSRSRRERTRRDDASRRTTPRSRRRWTSGRARR